MKKIGLILATLLLTMAVHAGDIEKVSITYTYESNNPHETRAQAEQKAIERAKSKAMEEKFGLNVGAVNSTIIRNIAEGDKVSSTNDVFSLRETSFRGEWIETIKEEILETTFKDDFWIVRVHVVGRARSHSAPKANIHYALVKDPVEADNRDQFRDESDLYMHFSSPVSGSLCVYLVDENKDVYCLLPYSTSTTGCQAVEANKDYTFFSEKMDKNAEELILTCERTVEQNAVFIVFTPNGMIKAKDNKGGENWRGESLPRQLSYNDFMKWLAKNQMHDEQMVVKTEVITIRK